MPGQLWGHVLAGKLYERRFSGSCRLTLIVLRPPIFKGQTLLWPFSRLLQRQCWRGFPSLCKSGLAHSASQFRPFFPFRALSLLSLCKSGFCTRPSIGAGFRVRVWNAFCLAIQPKQSADISHSKTIFDQRLRHAQTCRVLSWATRRGNAQLVSGDYRSATGARGSVDNRADSQRVESGVGVDVNGITPHAKS